MVSKLQTYLTFKAAIKQPFNFSSMRPEDVNPSNFKVEKIIYNKDNFSIAIGEWREDNSTRFAMRWNEGKTIAGYPSYAGNPMWFQLPKELTDIIETLKKFKNY